MTPVLSMTPGLSGSLPPDYEHTGIPHEDILVPVSGKPATIVKTRRLVVAAMTSPAMRVKVPAEYGYFGNVYRDPEDLLGRDDPMLTVIHQAISPILRPRPGDLDWITPIAVRRIRSLDFTSPVDLVPVLDELTGLAVTAGMGIPPGDWPKVRDPVAAAESLDGLAGDGRAERVRGAWEVIYAWTRELAWQQQHGGQSLLARCGTALRDRQVPERDILATYATLTSGWPTPLPVLTRIISVLLDRPDLTGACRATPGLWPALVEEVMRVTAHFLANPRIAAAPVTLAGQLELEPGDVVIPATGAALCDPSVVRDRPRVIDPVRWAPRALAYGTGPHKCPAREWSNQLMTILVTVLFTRCPWLEYAERPVIEAGLMPGPARLLVTRAPYPRHIP